MHAFPGLDGGPSGNVLQSTIKLNDWDTSRSLSDDTPIAKLTCVQTLILLIIEADNRLPGAPGPTKDTSLGKAIAVAVKNAFFRFPYLPSEEEQVYDSDGTLRLRAWWSLAVLDRWNAISSASSVLIRDELVVLPPRARTLLGERLFLMARTYTTDNAKIERVG
jgi:hypothetical protein